MADIQQYIQAIQRGEIPAEREFLTDDMRFDDTVTTALRANEGINLANLTDHHRDYLMARAQKFINQGLLAQEGENIRLTKKGLFVSDSIMADFMYV